MAITITAATWAANKATYTTSAAHGIPVGSTVTITGVLPAGYNGNFTTIAGTTGSTIVVAMPTNPGTYASGGAVLSLVDPFTVFPAIVTGRMGVARDGSVWATAKNAMTMVAGPGTVNPQMLEAMGVQPTAEEAEETAVGDDDDDAVDEARGRRSTRRHHR